MFDTSIVRPRAIASQGRYGLLTASVVFHFALFAAAVSATIASTRLPNQAPDQMELYRPAEIPVIPPPLGRPDAPRREPQAAPAQPKQPAAPSQEAAPPSEIPSETPTVQPEILGSGTGTSTGEPVSYGDPSGVPGGIGEVPTTPQPQPTPLTPGGEVRAARVLTRVQPVYPKSMLPIRYRDVTVSVRAVIDKDGHIRDAQVIQSSWPPFNEAVLTALQQWTFAPGTLRGQPVDTYFELTVKFQVR